MFRILVIILFYFSCGNIFSQVKYNQKKGNVMDTNKINVRYMVEDVDAAVSFYTEYLDFKLDMNYSPIIAGLIKGNLRLLLSGRKSSAGIAMPDGSLPVSGGWNRIQLIVEDIASEVTKLKAKGAHFRNEIVSGKGGSQILLVDPSGNLIELFQPTEK